MKDYKVTPEQIKHKIDKADVVTFFQFKFVKIDVNCLTLQDAQNLQKLYWSNTMISKNNNCYELKNNDNH